MVKCCNFPAARGFDPTTLQLMFSRLGITYIIGFASLLLITLPILVASTMGDLAEVTKPLL